MSLKTKGREAEGIGPIAEGVKEPDKMEGGLLLTNYCKTDKIVWECSWKDDKGEEVDVGLLGGWTRREMMRIGVCAGGRRRRRRKIGAVAAGLRARQDYLPSGDHSCFLFREDIRTILWRKQARQTDGHRDGGMERYGEGGMDVGRDSESEKLKEGFWRDLRMSSWI